MIGRLVLQSDPHDPQHTGRGLQGQIDQVGGHQRIRGAPGRVVVAEGPVGHGLFLDVQRQPFAGSHDVEPFPFRQKDHHLGIQRLFHVPDHRLQHGVISAEAARSRLR